MEALTPLRLRVACRSKCQVSEASPGVIQAAPRLGEVVRVIEHRWELTPESNLEVTEDLYGNRLRRGVLGEGLARLCYDAVVEVTAELDAVEEPTKQQPIQELEGEK